VGMLMGLDLSLNPFSTRPSYAKIAHLPLHERVTILRQPEFKQQLLAEEHVPSTQPLANMMMQWIDKLTLLDDPPNYFPPADAQLGSRAARQGTTALALAYDLMLEQDGHAILYMPSSNYSSRTPGPVFEMMRHPDTLVALGDGGAHYGFICDAGYPTFVLTYWARDAEPAYRFSIEWAVNALARAPAEAVGLTDRGLVAVGYKADLNVIDYDNLKLARPVTKYDLPSGGRRLWQPSTGYQATIVSGVVAQSDDQPTGALPGRLVRGTGYRLPT
jgi:N-acyl-D-amino-acid deacylase